METLKQWVHHKTELANAGSIMIKTRVGDVQYTDMGKGIPVIHSHGSPAGCDAGPRAFGRLAEEGGLRFITPSRPGFLKTPLSVGKTAVQQADMFVALMDSLKIENAVIHAWSGGGPPAIEAAKKYPGRFKGLILYSCLAHRWGNKVTFFKKMILSDPGEWAFTIMQKMTPEAFRKKTCQEMGLDYEYLKNIPERMALVDCLYDFMSPASLRNDGSFNDMDHYSKIDDPEMEKISIPTLITFSPSDNQIPISNAEVAHEKIPHSRFIQFEHGGHIPLADPRADFLNGEMIQFIRQCHET